jgi:hypothetical protein
VIPGRPVRYGTNVEEFIDEIELTIGDIASEDNLSEILVSLYTVDNGGAWNHPNDAPAMQSQAFFRIRGNSSRYFDKANFRIRLIERADDAAGPGAFCRPSVPR